LDLGFGFLQMFSDSLAQLLRRSSFSDLRQSLHQLFFRVVEVAQLIQQEILDALHRHRPAPFSMMHPLTTAMPQSSFDLYLAG
jgi:hypothetical protein